jgi:hypothetical protein
MLGRPFGAPHAPDLQGRVLRALLALFEQRAGPVLVDFPEEAPASGAGQGSFAGPGSAAQPDETSDDAGEALRREMARLAPWYDLARTRRGRTTVGISGLPLDRAAPYVASYLGASPEPPYGDGITPGMALKRACDDLKAYYYEAAAARPGDVSPPAIDHWFWHETAAGRVFLALRQVCLGSADPSLRPLGEIALVPQAIIHAPGAPTRRGTGP